MDITSLVFAVIALNPTGRPVAFQDLDITPQEHKQVQKPVVISNYKTKRPAAKKYSRAKGCKNTQHFKRMLIKIKQAK